MSNLHIKKDDTVIILSGDDKGVKGKVLETSPAEGKVIVEGANKIKKHVKARRQGEVGGIVEAEGAMYACKVALYCENCKKGVRSQVKVENGEKIRVCAKCGQKI